VHRLRRWRVKTSSRMVGCPSTRLHNVITSKISIWNVVYSLILRAQVPQPFMFRHIVTFLNKYTLFTVKHNHFVCCSSCIVLHSTCFEHFGSSPRASLFVLRYCNTFSYVTRLHLLACCRFAAINTVFIRLRRGAVYIYSTAICTPSKVRLYLLVFPLSLKY
jgi:hypothetical protein